MKILNNIYIKIGLWSLALILIIGLASSSSATWSIEKIHVRLNGDQEIQFLSAEKVIEKIKSIHQMDSGLVQLSDTDTKKLEQEILRWDHVKSAEVSLDISGVLNIDIIQDLPLVRLIGTTGKSLYLNKEATLIPLSDHYTARLPLITGIGADSLMKPSYLLSIQGMAFFELIQYISSHPFWSKQIAQLDIDSKGRISMYPQVGREEILFGQPNQFEEKFLKLKTYYQTISPNVGRNRYKIVNLTIKGQIVCE